MASEPENPNGLNQQEMERILHEYQKAVQEEFEMATQAKPENAVEATRDFCRAHLGEALAQIHFLAKNADSETVKLNASKFIVAQAIDEAKAEGDPIRELMKELQQTG